MNGSDNRPAVTIDMRKCLIRIHKKTIEMLGDPEYVVLIINPKENCFAIKGTSKEDQLARRIRKTQKHSYELVSHPLINTLREVFDVFEKDGSYYIKGKMIHSENIAVFAAEDAETIDQRRGKH